MSKTGPIKSIPSPESSFLNGLVRLLGLVGALIGTAMLAPALLSGSFLGGVLLLGIPILLVGALAFSGSIDGYTGNERKVGFGEWFVFAVVCMLGIPVGILVLFNSLTSNWDY